MRGSARRVDYDAVGDAPAAMALNMPVLLVARAPEGTDAGGLPTHPRSVCAATPEGAAVRKPKWTG